MSKDRMVLFPSLALILAAGLPVWAQSVVSTHSGVIYFFEGSVYNGGEPLEQKFGKFPEIGEGGELRTERGRAEVLLTPGVFLRVDENGSIRMVSNRLTDTRVELLSGSAIVESNEGGPNASVELIYRSWRVRIPHDGVYRIDSEPPQVKVYKGEVNVIAEGQAGTAVAMDGEVLPLAAVLVAEQPGTEQGDAFKNWAMSRSQAVSADNSIAAEIFDEPKQIDATGLALGGYSYFPTTGVPALGMTNPYGLPYGLSFWSPYQATLNSVYLPGYAYGLQYSRWPRGVPIYSRRIGIGPSRTGTGLHQGGYGPPRFGVEPTRIGPPRGAPHAGSHGGGRR